MRCCPSTLGPLATVDAWPSGACADAPSSARRLPLLDKPKASYQMVYPPSTRMSAPLIMSDIPEAKKSATAATSSGSAKRRVGMSTFMASPFSPAHALRPRSVMTTVGEMAFTVTPRGAHSYASTLVSPSTPAFDAQ